MYRDCIPRRGNDLAQTRREQSLQGSTLSLVSFFPRQVGLLVFIIIGYNDLRYIRESILPLYPKCTNKRFLNEGTSFRQETFYADIVTLAIVCGNH